MYVFLEMLEVKNVWFNVILYECLMFENDFFFLCDWYIGYISCFSIFFKGGNFKVGFEFEMFFFIIKITR